MSVIYQQITSDYAERFSGKPAAAKGWLAQRLVFMPGSTGLSELRRQFSKPLFILMTVVALVLFIACANLANLLLAKAIARQREMAVRVALGAPRTRLMRQVLTESLVLTSLGGILGLLFAMWGSNLLVTWMSLGRTPIVLNLRPDVRVLAFTAVACFVSILPACLGTWWRDSPGENPASQFGRERGSSLFMTSPHTATSVPLFSRYRRNAPKACC